MLCEYKTWNMVELQHCMAPYLNFNAYTKFFILNDLVIRNWSHALV
ncbi:MAG: hypothetical protein P4M11_10415 [Candidatus Pacebacteria bacterium]|nr:hypothetical protein [Candidatus Paceibacterota bacterium]